MVNIDPGLCDKDDWPSCETGTLLAQAVPANYAADELLTNWTKPRRVLSELMLGDSVLALARPIAAP